jgi:hypothetical protein
VQKEAAQGEGENLDALTELTGKKDKMAFPSRQCFFASKH